MQTDKKGTQEEAIALVGLCHSCGEAVRILITKQELKIMWKAMKLPIQERNLWVEKQFAKLKIRGSIT